MCTTDCCNWSVVNVTDFEEKLIVSWLSLKTYYFLTFLGLTFQTSNIYYVD